MLYKKITIARDLLNRFGWKKFSMVIFPWLFHRNYIFYAVSTEGAQNPRRIGLAFRLELAKRDDLPLLIKIRPGFYTLSQLRKRYDQGHFCFLGWAGNEPIHIRWIFVHSVYLPYLHRTLVLNSGVVFTDEAYTASRFRGRGIYSAAGRLMRETLNEMGYKEHVTLFPSWDVYLQKSTAGLNSKMIGEGGLWNILGLKRHFWKGAIRDSGDGKISILWEGR